MRLNRRSLWLAIALFVICALLRCGLLKRQGIWADEAFSLAMATGHSLEHPAGDADPAQGDFVERTDAGAPETYKEYLQHDSPPASPARVVRAVFKSDTSPPLYYLLLYGWTRALGTGDSSLRLFSVAASLACFPLIWRIGRKIGGTNAAICALVLFTFSPTSVYYGTEGRMYSLVWFFTLCTMAASLEIWQRGSRWPLLALWILSAAGGLLTHYFFLFVLAAIGLWLMIFPGRASRVRLIVAAIAVALLITPWYVQVPATLKHWRVTDYWLTLVPNNFNRLSSILWLPWTFFTVQGTWLSDTGFRLEQANGYILGALALVAVICLNRRLFTPKRALLWLCVFSAFAGLVLFDAWRKTFVVDCPRYALAGFPAAILLAGYALGRVPRIPRYALALAIIAVWALGDRKIYQKESRVHALDQIAGIVAGKATADDLVIVSSIPSGVTGVARYMQSTSGTVPRYVSWVEQLKGRKTPDDLIRLAQGHSRIILVRVHEVAAEPLHGEWLAKHADVVDKIELRSAQIDIFEPRQKDRFASLAREAEKTSSATSR